MTPVLTSERVTADLLIDRARLSEVLGREVHACRLRFKPFLSTTAVLAVDGGSAVPHWIQVSHDAHGHKVVNAVRRAVERGQRVEVRHVDGLTVALGALDTDPRLQRGLDVLRTCHPSVAGALAVGELEVLRYNPRRRLVLRRRLPGDECEAVRVTAHKQHGLRRALAALSAAGVPVVEPLPRESGPTSRRVTVSPWFGRGDLAQLARRTDPGDATAAAGAAGAALARLHGSRALRTTLTDPALTLSTLVTDLTALDPDAAHRMGELAGRTAARIAAGHWPVGSVHGDFSADQVLVGGRGEDPVRLIDFDRAGRGALLSDLGSFVADELVGISRASTSPDPADLETLPLTAALLSGYAARPGAVAVPPDGFGLRTWVARALLTRATEPFRSADPDWLAAIHRRLDQVEEVLR
ncbi:phosphotransferase [Knoellia sp. CPCC 206435]|uniref:phosphotransferase n=1 Tax=Knoellia terrae TaxID=3404797 RepID=UPI003B430DD6